MSSPCQYSGLCRLEAECQHIGFFESLRVGLLVVLQHSLGLRFDLLWREDGSAHDGIWPQHVTLLAVVVVAKDDELHRLDAAAPHQLIALRARDVQGGGADEVAVDLLVQRHFAIGDITEQTAQCGADIGIGQRVVFLYVADGVLGQSLDE